MRIEINQSLNIFCLLIIEIKIKITNKTKSQITRKKSTLVVRPMIDHFKCACRLALNRYITFWVYFSYCVENQNIFLFPFRNVTSFHVLVVVLPKNEKNRTKQ